MTLIDPVGGLPPEVATLVRRHRLAEGFVHTDLEPARCACAVSTKVVTAALRQFSADGGTCHACGGMTVRTGTCTTCTNCGETGGCG